MIDKQLYQMHQTPNAVMHTLAAPSTGTSDLAVWTVEMRAGQTGPAAHRRSGAGVGDPRGHAARSTASRSRVRATIPAGAERRIEARTDARALVASRAPITVATGDGDAPAPLGA